MNHWDRIKAHYDQHHAELMAERPNEWAIDPYAWDTGILTMTPIERWLWHDIRAYNVVMYPQYPVGGVFLDFANPKAKVGIECDGAAYHLDKEKDVARDIRLGKLGWTIYRLTGSECWTDSDEETGEKGFARKFVEIVADGHNLRRLANGPGRLVSAGDFTDQVIESFWGKS